MRVLPPERAKRTRARPGPVQGFARKREEATATAAFPWAKPADIPRGRGLGRIVLPGKISRKLSVICTRARGGFTPMSQFGEQTRMEGQRQVQKNLPGTNRKQLARKCYEKS